MLFRPTRQKLAILTQGAKDSFAFLAITLYMIAVFAVIIQYNNYGDNLFTITEQFSIEFF